jgi:hypothetical protein
MEKSKDQIIVGLKSDLKYVLDLMEAVYTEQMNSCSSTAESLVEEFKTIVTALRERHTIK